MLLLLPFGNLGAQSVAIPTIEMTCGPERFFIMNTPVPSGAPCSSCCNGVLPSCQKMMFQISLRLDRNSLPPSGNYNNGNFLLSYKQIQVAVEAGIDAGSLTNLNKEETDICPGPALSGPGFANMFKIVSNEDTDMTTLTLGGPNATPPPLEFVDYSSGVLFTMVLDYFPGEFTNGGVVGSSFRYTNLLDGMACTAFQPKLNGSIPHIYPMPNTLSNLGAKIGTPICGMDVRFPVEMVTPNSFTASSFDVAVLVQTNGAATPLLKNPSLVPAAGMPIPISVNIVPQPNNDGYKVVAHYDMTSFNPNLTHLFDLVLEPLNISNGYNFTASILEGGRVVTSAGCDKLRVSGGSQSCTAPATPACGYEPLIYVAPVSNGGGFPCPNGYSVNIALRNNTGSDSYKSIKLQVDFDLEPGVGIVAAEFSADPNRIVNITGNSIVFEHEEISWGKNDAIQIQFDNTGGGCMNSAAVRRSEVNISGSSGDCVPEILVEGFPACKREVSGQIAAYDDSDPEPPTPPTSPTYYFLSNVEVNLSPENSSVCFNELTFTNNCLSLTGEPNYGACVCSEAEAWRVTPTKNDDLYEVNNILTEMDLKKISRHILNLEPLGPYGMIAADANNDGKVSSLDIVALRDLLDGDYPGTFGPWPSTFAPSWRFVPKDWVFADPTNPFFPMYPSSKVVNLPAENIDFVAIKTGAMLHSSNDEPKPSAVCVTSAFKGSSPIQDCILSMITPEASQASEVIIPVRLGSGINLSVWQLGLHFDPTVLEFIDAQFGNLEFMSLDNFNLSSVGAGKIIGSWHNSFLDSDMDIQLGEALFYIHFKTKRDIKQGEELFSIDLKSISSNGWDHEDSKYKFKLDSKSGNLLSKDTDINTGKWSGLMFPNPTQSSCILDVLCNEGGEAVLNLYNPLGKCCLSKSLDLELGNQLISIPELANLPPGLYHWSLVSSTKKSITGQITKQ